MVATLLSSRCNDSRRLGWLRPHRWIADAVATIAFAVVGPVSGVSADPSDWICTWIDGPRQTEQGWCVGAVHCRLAKAYSFIPMVRKVDCPLRGKTCKAEECLEFALLSEHAEPTH
jgi:hypothetical protein